MWEAGGSTALGLHHRALFLRNFRGGQFVFLLRIQTSCFVPLLSWFEGAYSGRLTSNWCFCRKAVMQVAQLKLLVCVSWENGIVEQVACVLASLFHLKQTEGNYVIVLDWKYFIYWALLSLCGVLGPLKRLLSKSTNMSFMVGWISPGTISWAQKSIWRHNNCPRSDLEKAMVIFSIPGRHCRHSEIYAGRGAARPRVSMFLRHVLP